MEKVALFTAGIVFLAASILHLLRLLLKTEIKIGVFVVPLWLSIFGVIVPLLLSIWMFKTIK